MSLDRPFAETAAIRSQLGAIFVSLELSRSTWLVTSLSPGAGEKLSKRGIKAGESVRDRLLARLAESRSQPAEAQPSPVALLMRLNGVGPEFAASLRTEGLCRSFANRRQAGAYPGLPPSPWRNGKIEHEQGLSKAGNPRLRTKMLQLAWLWLQHQPQSALAQWRHRRLPGMTGKAARKRPIVALARKLFVALWKFTSAGVVIEGAVMKTPA